MCQETSPEPSEGLILSSPTRLSPLPPNPHDSPDLDLESQPPIIHDIVTSSPSDNEHLGATPFVTNIDFGAPLDILDVELPPAEPEEPSSAPPLTEIPVSSELVPDMPADIELSTASPAQESPVFTAEPKVNILTETLTATDPPSHFEEDTSLIKDITDPPSLVPESQATECPIDDSLAEENLNSPEAAEQSAEENEEMEPAEEVTQDEIEEDEEGMGLFYINVT